MKRISTPYTFSVKMFPFLFFGFLAFFAFLLVANGAYETNPMFLVVLGVMAVIGYFSTKTSLQNVVDEVYDCGDFLLVRKRGEEDNIPLSNIMNVNFNGKPARITLTLATPGKFGSEISFAPPPQIYVGAYPKNEIAGDLIARAGQARSARAF